MAIRKEDASSEMQSFQTGSSWIPATPAKSSTEQLMCSNAEETRLVDKQNVEAQPTTLTENIMKDFDVWQASGVANPQVLVQNPSLNEVPVMNMSFGSLLALAEARGKQTPIENALAKHCFATSSGSNSGFCPQMEGGLFSITVGNSSQQDHSSLRGANTDPEFKTPSCYTRGIDLNAPPRMISDPRKITSSQFEPITPEKKYKAEYRQDESAAYSSVDEVPTNKEKENATDGVKRSQPSESMSTPGQANHKPDREGMEEVDLSKTPQQKPRRKKHRPKVIIEGQKKTTPKARAEKTGVPRKNTTEKRKYARKNKVNSPAEGETSLSYLDRSPNTETPVAKRRYARRKTNDPDVNMDRGTTETKEAKVTRSTRSSCKRSLNFNSDGSQAEKTKVEEVVVMATSHEVAHKVVNQVKERCLSSLEEHPRRPSTAADQAMCTRGKCHIVFSDVTHDKEANAVQMPKSQSDSIGSSACLNSEQERSLKRKSINTTVEAVCNRNETGILYNSVQAYAPYFPTYPQSAYVIGSTPELHFPTIYKKKRTEKGSMPTSSAQVTASAMASHARLQRNAVEYSCTKMFMSPTNQGYAGALNEAYNPLFHHANDGTRTGRQVFADLLALGATQSFRRRRSRGPTRRRNVASLLEELPASSRMRHEPHTCMEALVADTRSTMITKKRSKRSTFVSATVQNPFHHQNFASTSSGPPLALTWKSMSPIDSIVEQLNQLHLSAESSRPLRRRYNALAAFSGYQEQHALVPYQSSAAVVPFDNSFDEVRRRRPRPKVELDDETTRVWKLLLENINSEGVDGTDEDKAKWWEEERRVFKGRADSFIARMHLVQGDRRFSPWKGSVVDSVVGVFLTQNVSDHLSSSAFMSMAARYPVKSEIHPAEAREENLGCKINEPEICELDSDRKFVLNKEILNQSVCCEDTKNSEIATNKSISLGENGREAEDALSSQTPEISSQNSADSPVAQTTERSEFYLPVTSEGGATVGVVPNRANNSTPFVKLLQMAETVLQGYDGGSDSLASNVQTEGHFGNPMLPAKTRASCSQSTLSNVPNSGTQATALELTQRNRNCGSTCSSKEFCAAEISEFSSESACGTTIQKTAAVSFDESQRISSPNAHSCNNEQIEVDKKKVGNYIAEGTAQNKLHGISGAPNPQNLMDAMGSTSNVDNSKGSDHREVNSNKNGLHDHQGNMFNGAKAKGGRPKKEKENQVDWDHLRKQTDPARRERARTANTMDSVDWEAVRCADVSDIAQTIKERGMNNMLAERIKDFLNRIVRDHGSIDLEWLRDVPPDKAKEYLLSVRGLGLKSVECVRLLTLHHLAFPVDTNVGRIAVRLGWVPLQPLPESLQLHLLELYPILESIQKFLWPRLCKLDQKTLYELHYQMITFGKVFCTKSKPNCNACPMRGECRHFASAFASARLALPAPQDQSIVSASENIKAAQNSINSMNTLQLPPIRGNAIDSNFGVSNSQPIIEEPASPEPIIEVPATPEPDQAPNLECDIEDISNEDPDEIPTIQLNMEQFTHNLQSFMQQNTELQEGDMSKALVALTSAAASIPVPKLKNVSRLRTEHQVYELPDSHPLLEGMDKREPDDPSPYLLGIWTPGETMDSIEPPEKRCSSQGLETLCSDETCLSCNSIREANSQTVRGTLLIPCRTAMRGSFPLNGTYFQVNEVFSDHETSLSPIDVPRAWLWNLSRRTVYFGTSIPTIFKGLSTEGIQYCFWRGFVCVRGFDRRTRAPRPLIARLHFPASKLNKGKGKMDDNHA